MPSCSSRRALGPEKSCGATRQEAEPGARVERLERVDGTEHLGEVAAGGAEVELDVVALADHAVAADGEPVAVDLEPVPEAGLDDPLAEFDLADQAGDVGQQVGVDASDVVGDDGTEQQSTESRRRIDREHEVPERHPPGGHRRPGVEHLQLGQQHAAEGTPGRSVCL